MQQKIQLHYYTVKRHAHRNTILILALAKITCLKIQNTIMKNLEISFMHMATVSTFNG